MLLSRLKGKRAFTLIELLIVITVIAILSVAFLPRAFDAPRKARDTVKKKTVSDIQASAEAKLLDTSLIPDDADGDAADVNSCLTDAVKTNLGLTVLPLDASKKESCSAVVADADKYFYRATSDFYIVGVVMEVTANANAAVNIADLNGAANAAAARALIVPPPNPLPAGKLPYYIVVGPS